MITAQEESSHPGEVEAKVAMVDNLVNLFIQGNALRAQNTLTKGRRPTPSPVKLKTMKLLEGIKKDLGMKNSEAIRIKPSQESKKNQVKKAKKKKNNVKDRINGRRFPVRLHRPKDPVNTFQALPGQKSYDKTIDSRERQPKQQEETEKKSAPLIVDRNPLLRLLEPSVQDEKDKLNFSLPSYRQDPLLRQLLKHPDVFKEDFLELPKRKQDTLLKILQKEGGSSFDPSILTPPSYKQNPLLRLLTPTRRDEEERDQFSPPRSRQDPLLRQLTSSPQDFTHDFLELPSEDQEALVQQLMEEGVPRAVMVTLSGDQETQALTFQSAPLILDRNPLLQLLEQNNQDEKDKFNLSPPSYRQDPLLRQLLTHPVVFKNDFLELPRRKQDTLLKILRQKGGNSFDSSILTPPDYKQNPLLRLLSPTGRDQENRDHFSPPSLTKDLLLQQLASNPDNFSDDFVQLPGEDQEAVVQQLMEDGVARAVMVTLAKGGETPILTFHSAPLLMEKNPLLRLLEPSDQDEKDKLSFSPPPYRQDPLLRQLLTHPVVFRDDFLELPRRKQDTLLKILQQEGGAKFDPSILTPPGYKQNPLLRLLTPSGRDKDDRDQFSPPGSRQDPLLRKLISSPQDFSYDFLQLPTADQEAMVQRLIEEGAPRAVMVTLAEGEKAQLHTFKSAPLLLDRNPLLRLLKSSNQDEKDKSILNPPPLRKASLVKQLIKHPEVFKDDFMDLPSRLQNTLIKILKEEGSKAFDPNIILKPDNHKNPLLRLLKPTEKDNLDKMHFSPPRYRQNPLLRQLSDSPEDYREDFLSLPQRSQEDLVEVLEVEIPGVVDRLAPLTVDRNPLLRLLQPTGRDHVEKDHFSPPDYRQDPLLRQLTSTPKVRDLFWTKPLHI